jgi:TatA/E family protein of Tat protein translocase
MGSLGIPELLVIFLVALILFGPKKLPEIGRTVGKHLAEFKRASNELKHTFEEEIRLSERQQQQMPAPPAMPTVAPPHVVSPEAVTPQPVAPADTVPRELFH